MQRVSKERCIYCSNEFATRKTCDCKGAKSERTRMRKGSTLPEPCLGQCAVCKMPFMSKDVDRCLDIICPGCGHKEPYQSVINWKALYKNEHN